MWVRASTEPAASGRCSAWPSTSSIRSVSPAASTRRAPPASISGLWSIPTTRHGYRRASAIATAAVPVATSATTASVAIGGRRDRLDHEVVPAAVLAEREELRPAVVVAGDAGEERSGRASCGRRWRSPAVPSHTCRATPLALAVLGRGVVDPGAAAACGLTTRRCCADGRRSRRCASTPGVPFRVGLHLRRLAESARVLELAGARHARRSAASSARRWRRSTWAPTRCCGSSGRRGPAATGRSASSLVTPLPAGFDEMRARGIAARVAPARDRCDRPGVSRRGSCPG